MVHEVAFFQLFGVIWVTILEVLEGSGGPFGKVWGPLGEVLGTLGGILGALSPKTPSRIPKRGPKSHPRRSQRQKNRTGAPLFGVSGGPKMTKNHKKNKNMIKIMIKTRKRQKP